MVAAPASEPPVDLTENNSDPSKDELPAEVKALVARLGEPSTGNSHGWMYIRWQHKKLEITELRLLGKHAFMKRPLTKQLSTLDLTGSVAMRDADGSHVGVSVLVDALASGAFAMLKELTLSENNINDADGVRLLGALADADCLEEFATLKLEKNELGDATAKRLASGELLTLSSLYISDNLIGDEGALAIAAGSWPRLDRLFMQNNLFGDEAVEALGRASAEPDSTLKNVRLVSPSMTRRCSRFACVPTRAGGARFLPPAILPRRVLLLASLLDLSLTFSLAPLLLSSFARRCITLCSTRTTSACPRCATRRRSSASAARRRSSTSRASRTRGARGRR